MLAGSDLGLRYSDGSETVDAVRHVSIRIAEREFVGLLGPSGSGKSSLLYLLAGLKRPTEGRVEFRGTDMDSGSADDRARLRREHFGFIFQNHFLINYLTGLENIRTGGAGNAGELLDELGAGHCRDKFPWQMSAGEKQRVAIARAVVHHPAVVFADEPTASLDRPNADLVIQCLRRVTKEGALFVVTHDESIVSGATRTLHMSAGMIK